jgi:hypothetical protein
MTIKDYKPETATLYSSDQEPEKNAAFKIISKMSDDQIRRCLHYFETGIIIDDDGRTLLTETRH